MTTVLLPDVQGIPNFDVSERTGISSRWKRWHRAFELYSDGKGVTKPDQKRALLLHTAGMEVQDIFLTLPTGVGIDAYTRTVDALNKCFTPQANVYMDDLCLEAWHS